MISNSISIVIGSWGSYNKCNERALGSKWLDLSDFNDWEEIEEELKKQGFELDGIDEELFIQDIEGIEDSSTNWDYCNPQDLFEVLKEAEVLADDYKYEIIKVNYRNNHILALNHMFRVILCVLFSKKIFLEVEVL